MDRLPYLLDGARRAGILRIVLVREAEVGVGPVILRIPAAEGRILANRGLLEDGASRRSTATPSAPGHGPGKVR